VNYKEIISILAPCGLNCEKCVAYKDGFIAKSARDLNNYLGNFESFAERYVRLFPEYQNYPAFAKMLDYLANPQCDGCRKGHCLYTGCGVGSCEKIESGELDFCFQCNEFPCERPQFHPDLDRRWKERNSRMKDIGVEGYFEESKDLPRYV
jgi:hypothetical protein